MASTVKDPPVVRFPSNVNILGQIVSRIILIQKCLQRWLFTMWNLVCHCREITYIGYITEQSYEHTETSAKELEDEKVCIFISFTTFFA